MVKAISMDKIQDHCDFVSHLLRSLSHPQRLLVLCHLAQSEKTVSELQSLCGISQSQLSQFLGRMRLEGLVGCRRNGRFQYYSIADKRTIRLIKAIQEIYCE